MGINVSQECCCCFWGIKKEINSETQNEKSTNPFPPEEVLKNLDQAKTRLILLLEQQYEDFYNGPQCKIGLVESEKGHIFRVVFVVPHSPLQLVNFLDHNPRNTWDKYVESCNKLAIHSRYSIMYIKYKGSISYSSKEIVIACNRENVSNGFLSYFTSVPHEKISESSDKIEVFEGGYLARGDDCTEMIVIVHARFGNNSLTKFMQKISEKFVLELVCKIIEIMRFDEEKSNSIV
ncbi:hypothetical protein SteCoe_33791 [Stentor coeruleus]|uniref:START domain-containing protein n=1 Tax=Stentor coeruleus TaxID=5963 RepID=A0A1R2AW65_9CILI|nr:hypothetical protein SteCoe_33791 [Stentor coeruleus]